MSVTNLHIEDSVLYQRRRGSSPARKDEEEEIYDNDGWDTDESDAGLHRHHGKRVLADDALPDYADIPPPSFKPPPPPPKPPRSAHTSKDETCCHRCKEGFLPHEKIVNTLGEFWHVQCFVCVQCFRPFPDDVFYEFEGRKYCEHDFQILYAPCCAKCETFITGRVIRAKNSNWHPSCFVCELCNVELADLGFVCNTGRTLCHECNNRIKATQAGLHICQKCNGIIEGKPLEFSGKLFHPYHFNCSNCSVELTADARELAPRLGLSSDVVNKLYCLRCHDKMGIPICGACRRPIEERVITALGKHWHVEHFACAKCGKPFFGHQHYERKGLAYCETHYLQLFGNLCYVCNSVIQGEVLHAFNKTWCDRHFSCSFCDSQMSWKTKFFEMDGRPCCKKCYERLPAELRKRLNKYYNVKKTKKT